MKFRDCGESGLRLPVMGIGCWSYGGGDYWGDQSQRDVDEVINAALDAGCNYMKEEGEDLKCILENS